MQLEPVQKCSHYVYQWTVYLSMTSTLGQPAQHETKQNARMLLTVWTRISCVFSHNSNSALVFSKHVPQGHTKLPPSKSFPRKVLLLSNHYSQGLTGAWKWKFNPADLTTGPSLTGRPGDLFDRMVGKPVCVCVRVWDTGCIGYGWLLHVVAIVEGAHCEPHETLWQPADVASTCTIASNSSSIN